MNHHRLIYTSFISPQVDRNAVRNIVRHAREKNRPLNVTGVLVFDGLRFCQYLEGPEAALKILVADIRADPRHLQFSIKEQGRLDGAPLFTGYPLGFAITHEPDDLDPLEKFVLEKSTMSGGSSAIGLFGVLLSSLRIEYEEPISR